MAGEQELAALDHGGPFKETNLAAVDRHRGVVAYLRGHYDNALDHFSRALERQRSAENLGNVLCALVRLGEIDEARSLFAQIRATLPQALVTELIAMVNQDPDLALLRTEDA
ncbi:MAG: pentatricopeptide repeat protein [bacterium]